MISIFVSKQFFDFYNFSEKLPWVLYAKLTKGEYKLKRYQQAEIRKKRNKFFNNLKIV